MEQPKRRTPTSPGLGLGDSGLRPKYELPSVPPTSDVGEMDPAAAPFSGEIPLERAEKISTRRPRRPPLRVDDVGDAAVAIASKLGRETRSLVPVAPKLLKTRGELSSAPINHQDAFVLSLIDGKTSTQGIVDLAAMPDGQVVDILERLARLGIVSLP